MKSSPLDALRNLDYPLLAAAVALVAIGILSVFSAGVNSDGIVVSREYVKQLVFGLSGLVFVLGLALVDYKRIKDLAMPAFILILLLLVYTRIFGRVVNGARSWLGLGDFGVQPSEFAKIAFILFLARYLEESEHESGFRRLLVSAVIMLAPMGVILSQPDFGTSLVFFPILVFMLFVAGLDRRYILFIAASAFLTFFLTVLPLWERNVLDAPTPFLFVLYTPPYAFIVLGALALLLGISLWGWLSYKRRYYFWILYGSMIGSGSLAASLLAHRVLKDYQIMRLIVFLDPSIDPRGSGWNILQSITAIGSGGFLGRGYLQGPQSHNRYIPQQSTDFIFSIIAEEWGFLGGLLVFGLFFLLLYRCVSLMRSARDRYALYVSAGLFGMFFFHFMINAGMAMGIMPITGIPLFFLSYGGSSLWTALVGVGILLGISARRYR